MEKLEKEYLQKSITYDKYRKLMHELVVQGKTTGPDQSPLQIKFTKLNEHRMHRLEKTVHLNDSLIKTVQSLNKKWIWVILTEAWCGDVAQNAPTIQKIADLNELITVHYLLRDENIPLMDQYLTDGGRAIPKLICYDVETLMPIGHWGPRPAPAQQLMHTLKSQQPPLSFDEIHEPLHKWYAEDRTQTLQKEMEDLIKDWIKII
jgi:hypothetical protein